MGKPSVFIEYLRELPVDRVPLERIGDWKEFHFHMDERRLRHQAARCMDCGVPFCHTGTLMNGTKFDSRRSPAAPATFSLSGLIQGWQQGIPGMKPGGIRRLFVPAALGYGAAGSGSTVPANADLVFEIKLISHHH